MIGLAALFFGTAILYSSVGFGGGSTYTALLVLNGVDYRAIPAISLVCNILVVSAGSWRFWRSGHVEWKRIWPLLLLSVPMAWLGGTIALAEREFVGILSLALAAAGIAMLFQPEAEAAAAGVDRPATWLEPLVGGGLGFLAGMVGIGGGIFLAPILHLLRWGGAKAIAGTCAIFILVNSVAGLAGQLGKPDGVDRVDMLANHWLLFPAVVVGGLIGSNLGSGRLRPVHLRVATALLVLYVAVRLGLRFHELRLGGAR